ncbi:hypothetical protein LWI29_030203 [Acer saccharum]|uniref:ABC transporter domain-containing protein n=1 Tax=Acer saccharum TaxID=4024 RepID=A0AA39T702_ACESA|nr:hypothetical protein LWI29_030203 [Acer saccharum]
MAALNGSEYFEFEIEAGRDSFARASNAETVEEDEEELMWAALARLPSQKQGNFALLRRTPSGAAGETEKYAKTETVDVRKLSRSRREQVVKKAFATNDQDNYRLLSAIKERLDRVGLEVPKVEVRFKNLKVVADVQTGSRALPTLINATRDTFERILTGLRIFKPKRHKLTILNDISGAVKPGRMTLLLGPPGSGKSTLLLALAGKLDSNLEKSGNVTYNGHHLHEFHVQRTSAYISETDNHIPELTVRETLDFAARYQGSSEGFAGYMKDLTHLEKERKIRPSPEIDAFMKASSVGGKKHSVSTDYVLKVLGLDVCSDTIVGNDMLRGVSGGQRKRVTTGEMVVGPRKTLFMDEISTGLDSSTTYQIVNCVRNFVHQMDATVLMALLQPAPETFDLFDDLVLLSEGYVVYQGPREDALEFFESLGFKLPPRKGVADFLQEVAFVGFVTCTMFLRTRLHPSDEKNGQLYLSCLFYGLVHIMFNGLSELSIMISRLPVFYKQRDNNFHPAWAWSIASWIVRVPYSIIEAVVWSCVVYYSVGFAPGFGRFFRFLFLLFSLHQMALGLFRMMASLARDMVIANIFGSAALLIIFLLGGFIIPKDMIKPWWVWGFWVSPLSYGQNALSVNEFTASRWNEKSAIGNNTVGYNILEGHGLPHNDNWYWIGVGALLLYALLFNSLVTLALAYLNPLRTSKTAIPLDDPEENCTGEGVGSSGAGKTTLMDVLAGRKTGGYIEGDIKISGHPKEQSTFARIAGYVEQNDIHSPQVTVEESLWFSSSLRLPKEVSKDQRKEFVEEVMSLVELDVLRHALVGLPGSSGLSTEQRKRLTIAVELVANPSIIFMDEPTSGLDARAAAIVMRTVRNTVDTGRTVVCTIHQPSIDIFESFDEGISGITPIRSGYNPATWMLEVTTPSVEERLGVDFADLYRRSDQYRGVESLIKDLSIPPAGSQPLKFASMYSKDQLSQFLICLWKQNLVYWRSPQYNLMRLCFTTIAALIFGTVFWDIGSKRDSTQALFMVMGALYSACIFLGVNNASSVQPIVSIERTVFYRERAAGMYAPFAYAAAQGLVEIPYILMQTIIYGIITYFMINFERTARKFFLYLVFMFLIFTCFTFSGMVAVGLTPNQHLAAVISTAFYSLWNLLSGFLIAKPNIPGWWIWFYYINPFSWTLRGVITSQLGDIVTIIDEPGYRGTVKEYLEVSLDFGPGMIGVSAAVLVCFCLLFFSVFAFSVKFLNFQRR